MGLDAHVRCDCFLRGKTRPHPIPGLVVYDLVEGPILNSKVNFTLQQSIAHDRWRANACEHPEGRLIQVRIGNMSAIAQLRSSIEAQARDLHLQLPTLLGQVLCSGTHAGDHIPASEIDSLRGEASVLQGNETSPLLLKFLSDIEALCDAAIKTANPIVF